MNEKYEFTTEEKVISPTITVRRIRAIKDIPGLNVRVGDLGGFLQFTENLAHEGDCWVAEESMVHGLFTRISGNAMVFGQAVVEGGSNIKSGVVIDEQAHVYKSDIWGLDIHIRGDVVLEHSTVNGESIQFEGEARISKIFMNHHVKRVKIDQKAIIEHDNGSLYISGSFITISGNARLENVETISGRAILINQDAVVKNGVVITGTNVSLIEASCLDGKIELSNNVELTECVSIFNTSSKYAEMQDVTLSGDFHKDASEFQSAL
jgi:UDP-3-O-[3-hydroxymyristoyl] glucosamine N-acyltransferase